jgi:hypothetical protein
LLGGVRRSRTAPTALDDRSWAAATVWADLLIGKLQRAKTAKGKQQRQTATANGNGKRQRQTATANGNSDTNSNGDAPLTLR